MNAENTNILGGWVVTTGDMCIEKHPEALAAFEKAINGLVGVKYEPIALLATQVVSGKNYCILCKMTPATLDPTTSLKLVFVYEDLNGNAVITKISDVLGEPACRTACANSDSVTVLGGWEVTAGDTCITNHPDALAAFEKAVNGLKGAKYEPVALLGTQIVSGKNYCILCRITPVILDPKPTFDLVYIYEDLNGNAVVTSIKKIVGTPIPGGFIANEGDTDLDNNPEVKVAFETAIKGILGVNYVPIAYLGSQVVAGMNYLILCESTIVYPNAKPKITLVTVNVDLDGNASLLRTEPLVLGITE